MAQTLTLLAIHRSILYHDLFKLSLDTPSGIDQDQVLEELLGKVKSSKTGDKTGINPFMTPEASNMTNTFVNASPNSKPPEQNPFRKNTGIKRGIAKQVSNEISYRALIYFTNSTLDFTSLQHVKSFIHFTANSI